MKVKILEFTEGARSAEGLAVIIDVFRAFSVACYAFDAGAAGIIATAEADEALRLSREIASPVLVGERDERKIEGFDLGNSPTEIIQADLRGKTVIHTTTAGTRGIISATNAETVLTGSFVNAGAVIDYIRSENPEIVTLVAMGYRATQSAEEDLLCAEYIESGLTGSRSITRERINALMHTSGRRFFEPANIAFSPPSDFFLCTMTDRFNFVLKASTRPDGNIALLRKECGT